MLLASDFNTYVSFYNNVKITVTVARPHTNDFKIKVKSLNSSVLVKRMMKNTFQIKKTIYKIQIVIKLNTTANQTFPRTFLPHLIAKIYLRKDGEVSCYFTDSKMYHFSRQHVTPTELLQQR